MTAHVLLPLDRFILSCSKRFCCRRYWIRVCRKSVIIFQESMDRFTSNFLLFSLICSGYQVKFINPPKFLCVVAINVKSLPNRKFCTPSVSSITCLFTKFSAPNVTNRASISTINTSTTAWRNSFIRYRKSEG